MSDENKPKFMPFELPNDDSEDDVFSSILGPDSAPETGAFPAISVEDMMRASAISGPRVTYRTKSGHLKTASVDATPFQIGRQDVNLKLDDPFVSSFHAQLRDVGGTWQIEDLGSSNGVFLRIADEISLEDHDELLLGDERLIFRTSWDSKPAPRPFDETTPMVGAPIPRNTARLIRYLRGGHIGGIYFLDAPVTLLGREGDFRLSGKMVSGIHASVERRDKAFVLKDMKSTHGTFVRIHDPVELLDGDAFILGRTRLELFYDE